MKKFYSFFKSLMNWLSFNFLNKKATSSPKRFARKHRNSKPVYFIPVNSSKKPEPSDVKKLILYDALADHLPNQQDLKALKDSMYHLDRIQGERSITTEK